MCVCNLVTLTEDRAPISFGLRVGLNNIYGDRHLPPCVRGPVGAAYWSVESDHEDHNDNQGLDFQPGQHATFQEVD